MGGQKSCRVDLKGCYTPNSMPFNPYPANVENMVAPTNASKWQIGFNSAFKGLSANIRGIKNKGITFHGLYRSPSCLHNIVCFYFQGYKPLFPVSRVW